MILVGLLFYIKKEIKNLFAVGFNRRISRIHKKEFLCGF